MGPPLGSARLVPIPLRVRSRHFQGRPQPPQAHIRLPRAHGHGVPHCDWPPRVAARRPARVLAPHHQVGRGCGYPLGSWREAGRGGAWMEDFGQIRMFSLSYTYGVD